MKSLKIFLTVMLLLSFSPTLAHPGHGLETNSYWHYLLSPMHAILVILTVAFIYLALKVKTDKKRRDA